MPDMTPYRVDFHWRSGGDTHHETHRIESRCINDAFAHVHPGARFDRIGVENISEKSQ